MNEPAPKHRINTYALELQVVQSCNLRCAGCAQSSPYIAGQDDVAVLDASLQRLKEVLRTSKLQIIGGEPTLHPEIDTIVRIAQLSPVSQQVVVKTNGLRLSGMSRVFWESVNQVIISIYPSTSAFFLQAQPLLEKLAKEHGTELIFRRFNSFQYIIRETPRTNVALDALIFKNCVHKTHTHSVKGGRFYRCSPSVNAKERLERTSGNIVEVDSLDLFETNDALELSAKLSAFIYGERLSVCSFCFGSSGGYFPHYQLRKPADE